MKPNGQRKDPPQDLFGPGAWIVHPSHGIGVVVRSDRDSVEARFDGETVHRFIRGVPITRYEGPLPPAEEWAIGVGLAAAQPSAPPRGRPAGTSSGGVAEWYSVPDALLGQLRRHQFVLLPRADGFTAQTSQPDRSNLLHLRQALDGTWRAKALSNSGFGKTNAYKRAAPAVAKSVRKALAAESSRQDTGLLVRVLVASGSTLEAAAKKFRPQRSRRSAPFTRFVQGGAPGLGRR